MVCHATLLVRRFRRLVLFLVLAPGLLFWSCATTGRPDLQDLGLGALAAVSVQEQVDYGDFGLAAAAINTLLQVPPLDPGSLAAGLRDRTIRELAPLLPFRLLDEAAVLASPGMADLAARQAGKALRLAAPGYLADLPGDAAGMADLLAGLPGCGAILGLQVRYTLVPGPSHDPGGSGRARIRAMVTLSVRDSQGRELLPLYGTGLSDQSAGYVLGGLLDTSGLQELCRSATGHALEALADALARSTGIAPGPSPGRTGKTAAAATT